MLVLKIPSHDKCCEILIQKGMLQGRHWITLMRKMANRFAILTDHTVKNLVGNSLQNMLRREGLEVELFSVPPGERSKTREWKQYLEDKMLEASFGRESVIIGLGGGVITDLAGFVAATYCRGISFVSIPTTILGQVDASIGGKVSVNTPHGKNLLGAFHQPRYVFIDCEALSTLAPEQIRNGMAEVIKYALIASPDLFHKLEAKTSWAECIEECCAIKVEIVEKDPQERGLRRILNFGHTVGHALETCMQYLIGHGEAVALGMLAEAYVSFKLGFLAESDFNRIQALLESYEFAMRLPTAVSDEELLKCMKLDKKALASTPRIVLLQKIGQTKPFEGNYCTAVDPTILQETFQWLRSR